MTGNPLVDVLLWIFLAVVVFVLIRQLVLWYWRIDDAVNLLREQTQLLREIRDSQREIAADTQSARSRRAGELLEVKP